MFHPFATNFELSIRLREKTSRHPVLSWICCLPRNLKIRVLKVPKRVCTEISTRKNLLPFPPNTLYFLPSVSQQPARDQVDLRQRTWRVHNYHVAPHWRRGTGVRQLRAEVQPQVPAQLRVRHWVQPRSERLLSQWGGIYGSSLDPGGVFLLPSSTLVLIV